MLKTYSAPAAAIAAILALSACGQSETESVDADSQAEINKAAVTLPPSILASRTYRCKDNSLLFATFYTDDRAEVTATEGGEKVTLTATGGSMPYTADGWEVSGSGEEITLTSPATGTLTCHV